MKHNYVPCTWCKEWDKDYRRDKVCQRCNNVREVIDPQELVCNMCGGAMCHEISNKSGTWKTDSPHGLYDAKVQGGYESYHLLDMNQYTFSLCEECLRKMFNQFKIKPEVSEINFDGDTGPEFSWHKDQEYYEYRVWYDAGHAHQAYLDKKCNLVKDCPNPAVYTRYCNNHFTEDCVCEEHKSDYASWGSYKLVPFIPNTLKAFL